MWLDWHWAVVFAGMLGIGGLVGQRSQRRAVKSASAFARETALVFGLYAVWQYAGRMSLGHVDRAFAHGRWVWDTERFLHLPSEAAFERSVLDSALVMRPLNFYYAFVHVPALIACLVWLFVFHRAHYPSLRRTLALTTAACLLIQLIPVAPPRMYPSLGFVDAAAVYGQSVYGKVGTGIADQLSALPSVHVAWAALVALAVVVAGTSRWRFWILAHPIITIVAVTVTANHWWLDGFVAIALVLAAWGIDHALRPVIAPLRIALPWRNSGVGDRNGGRARGATRDSAWSCLRSADRSNGDARQCGGSHYARSEAGRGPRPPSGRVPRPSQRMG